MKESRVVEVGNHGVTPVRIGSGENLVFIGGPCAIESLEHSVYMAEKIGEFCKELEIGFIFTSCCDKDCRSAPESFHGLGLDKGLDILRKIREQVRVPVVSDFSDPSWAEEVGQVCDLIQVPAYLCRQTSILRAAARTKKPVHLKKGQFMSPWNMKNSVRKLESFGCESIVLTDRGTFFGYNSLVNDMTSFPIMASTGYPVCFDATHSIQQPTSMGNISGGQREFIPYLVRSATACGVNALFMEVHHDPPNALSDANTVLDLRYLRHILREAATIHKLCSEMREDYGDVHVK